MEGSLAAKILNGLGITLDRAREEVTSIWDEQVKVLALRVRGTEEEEPPEELQVGIEEPRRQKRGRRFPQRSQADMDVEAAARRVVRVALREDLTPNDLTSELTVPPDVHSLAVAVAKADGVIAGMEAARQAFLQIDSSVEFNPLVEDGANVKVGDDIFEAAGLSRSLLAAERTALNLIQRLSGIATETARYVAAVEGTKARIIDTRKTTPGLRLLEKYAVRKGGGRNHRYNLSDGILIKDNHIVAAGGITAAVQGVREQAPHTLRIEVEVTNEDEINEALAAGADVLLLDNMTPDQLKTAVELIAGRALTEASGGITLETVRAVAESGVDFISMGALTHSVRALDISLQFRGGSR
jgi:nicotinate-nucleotide pyrophosphorylase (carboxylating)